MPSKAYHEHRREIRRLKLQKIRDIEKKRNRTHRHSLENDSDVSEQPTNDVAATEDDNSEEGE